MTDHHLAQFNIAAARHPTDDPRMADFMNALDELNSVADSSPGFVWRLVDEGSNDATSLRAEFGGVEQMVNLSVWESVDHLWNYVFRSGHLDFLRRRGEWFVPPAGPITVLWWVPSGHLPSVDEGLERLGLLRSEGPTDRGFTFRERFDPSGAREAAA